MVNSRAKGAQGEREFAHFISDLLGIQARRGQQFSGSPESPDVVTEIEGVHHEVKRVQNLNLANAYAQSKRDAGAGEIPVVDHRKDRGEWMLTLAWKDVPKFVALLAPYCKVAWDLKPDRKIG